MYFECNLPDKAPSYINPNRRKEMEEMFDRVRARHALLESALQDSGMGGATFSEMVIDLFKRSPEHFDKLKPGELAVYAMLAHDDSYVAPQREEWPNAIVVADCNFLTNDEWVAIRHLGIGGSDSAVLYGTGYKTPYALYHDKRWDEIKRVGDEPTPDEIKRQVFFDRGHQMEPMVINRFAELHNAVRIPESRMFRSKRYPNCVADIDAIFRMPDGNIYIFEAKTSVSENYTKWSGDKIPASYAMQVRQYPAVLDDDRVKGTHIGCLFTYDYILGGLFVGSDTDAGKFVSRFIPRDTAIEQELLAKEQEFFDDVIKAENEPPMGEGSFEEDMQTWTACHPAPDKAAPEYEFDLASKQVLDEYFRATAEEDKAKKVVKAAEERRKAVGLTLREMMGEASVGRLKAQSYNGAEDIVFKASPRSKTTFDKEKAEILHPGIVEACSVVTENAFVVTSIQRVLPNDSKKGK